MLTKKKKRKQNLFFKIAAAVFLLYSVGTLINLQIKISQKKAEVTQLQEKYDVQTQKNAALKSRIDSEITDEYIVDIARSKLGYILPGERIFEDIKNK